MGGKKDKKETYRNSFADGIEQIGLGIWIDTAFYSHGQTIGFEVIGNAFSNFLEESGKSVIRFDGT